MAINPIQIQSYQGAVTTFKGEGCTYNFKQGVDAISGVAAHEARNIRMLKAQAATNNYNVIDTSIEIKFAYDPKTKQMVVVGGESKVKYQKSPAISSNNVMNILNNDKTPDTSTAAVDKTVNKKDDKKAQNTDTKDSEYIKNTLVKQKQKLEKELQQVEQSSDTNNGDNSEQDYEFFVVNGLTERPADPEKQKQSIRDDIDKIKQALVQIQFQETMKTQDDILNTATEGSIEPVMNLLGAQYNNASDNTSSSSSTSNPATSPKLFIAPYTMSGMNVNLRVF